MKIIQTNAGDGNQLRQDYQYQLWSSEIHRVWLVLAVLISVILALVGLLFFASELLPARVAVGNLRPGLAILFLACVYEIFVIFLLHYIRKHHKSPPSAGRYLNVLIETSIPTVVIYIFSKVLTPAEALFSPPSYAYFLFILLSTLRLSFKLSLFTGLIAALEYSALVIFFRSELAIFPDVLLFQALPMHFGKAFIFLMGGVVAGLVSLAIHKSFMRSLQMREERNRVTDLFGAHVSPEVVHKLLNQPEQNGETRHVCVMFLDIANFTAFSEIRTPDEVVLYLNTVFDFMIAIVNDNKGIINKFLGDGFMAVFGAPLSDGRDSLNALHAATQIVQKVHQSVHTGLIPATGIRIGLHSGEVVTGNIGSTLRKEYTIIGDVVNTASRLEQLNKQFNSKILVSQAVLKDAQLLDDTGSVLASSVEFEINAKSPVNVRGRRGVLQIYEVGLSGSSKL